MEVAARIVTLRLAETFVISRESSDAADVVQVEVRHEGVSGFGEGAPIERYGESAESALQYVEAHADRLGAGPLPLGAVRSRAARRERAPAAARQPAPPRPPGDAP